MDGMDHGMLVKKIFESKPEGGRRMEGPRFRWLQDVEQDLGGINIRRW